jgi:hypothetical protein
MENKKNLQDRLISGIGTIEDVKNAILIGIS